MGHGCREAIETALSAYLMRLLALPYGRGLATLRTATASLGETFQLPELNVKEARVEGAAGGAATTFVPVNASAAPRGAAGEGASLPGRARDWALCHNAVAAGLSYGECGAAGKGMEDEWVLTWLWNLAFAPVESEQAGLVLGLGINGYLDKLNASQLIVHQLVVRMEPMLTMATLLGLASSKSLIGRLQPANERETPLQAR